jgi:hypothetical protein
MFNHFKRKKERIVVNAMLFSAAHVFLITFFIGAEIPYYIFVLGYFLAKLYENHYTLIPCIILHSINNLIVLMIETVRMN